MHTTDPLSSSALFIASLRRCRRLQAKPGSGVTGEPSISPDRSEIALVSGGDI
jgi:hypothetical protein